MGSESRARRTHGTNVLDCVGTDRNGHMASGRDELPFSSSWLGQIIPRLYSLSIPEVTLKKSGLRRLSTLEVVPGKFYISSDPSR